MSPLAASIRTLASHVLGVDESRVTVLLEERVGDKDGKPVLACDVRVDGELLTAAQDAAMQEVFRLVAEAAAITSEARAEGVTVVVKR